MVRAAVNDVKDVHPTRTAEYPQKPLSTGLFCFLLSNKKAHCQVCALCGSLVVVVVLVAFHLGQPRRVVRASPIAIAWIINRMTQADWIVAVQYWAYRAGGFVVLNVLDDPAWLALMFC